MTSPQKLATRFLHAEWERLSHTQRRVIQAITERRPVARDAVGELADARTFGERLADQLAEFGGSWRFILLFLGTMLIWAAVNTAVNTVSNAARSAVSTVSNAASNVASAAKSTVTNAASKVASFFGW